MRTNIGLLAMAAGFLALTAVYLAARGARLLRRRLRHGDDPSASRWLVRGIRDGVVGVALGAIAAGLLSGVTWLVVFGAVFLVEELYETGVLMLALEHSTDRSAGWRRLYFPARRLGPIRFSSRTSSRRPGGTHTRSPLNASRQTRPDRQVGAAPGWIPWAALRFSSATLDREPGVTQTRSLERASRQTKPDLHVARARSAAPSGAVRAARLPGGVTWTGMGGWRWLT